MVGDYEQVLGCKFILRSTYIPNESSCYYCADMFDDICNGIVSFDAPVCLCGDTNARTGNIFDNSDYVSHIFGLQDFENNDEEISITENDGWIKRANKDVKVNNSGRSLIELYKVNRIYILNARFGEDKGIWQITCHNHNTGNSVSNYAIVTQILLNYLSNFSLHEFDDFLPDTHSPISVSFDKKEIVINIVMRLVIVKIVHTMGLKWRIVMIWKICFLDGVKKVGRNIACVSKTRILLGWMVKLKCCCKIPAKILLVNFVTIWVICYW